MTVSNKQRAKRNDDKLSARLDNVPLEAPGAIIVDLDAICANWRALRDLVAPAKCSAVVKANAYGLGAKRVIPALASAGCEVFFVATLKEAIEARKLAPTATTYILDGIMPGTSSQVANSGAWPVVSTLDEAKEWDAYSSKQGPDTRLPCALQLDTGLNRLGLDIKTLSTLTADKGLMARLDVMLVMSHLGCADEPNHPMNEAQRNAFEHIRAQAPTAPASLAASDGLMLGNTYHFDLVRPGYALYGGQAFQGARTPVSNVVSAYTRVIQVRDCAPGDTVGYSATFKIDRPSRVATLALGYADGLARFTSSTNLHPDRSKPAPRVAFNGQYAPIVGRVSMDLITIDVTDIKDPPVKRGDWVEFIGPNLSLEDVGAAAGTIGYEVLTRLGTRFHRSYVAQTANTQNERKQ